MSVVPISELKTILFRGECLLGLDLGTKNIGIAVSDTSLIVASPLATMKRSRFTADAVRLIELIGERGIGGIVIGLPVEMDGREGPRCQSARQFATNLLERIEIPIAFWDERLSTAAIERLLVSEADMTRKRRREVVDKMAAAYILQGALDSMS